MIGLDIDGVLADFLPPFLKLLENRAGKGPIDPLSIVDPSFVTHPFLTREIIDSCMVDVSYDPAFWDGLAPLPTAGQWQALEDLSREERLVFVTHRYERDSYSIHNTTCTWLRRHGIRNPTVYFTQNHKSELVRDLKLQVFVDDRHENCLDIAENTEAFVMMPDRCYNNSFQHPKVKRIQDLEDLFTYLGEGEKSFGATLGNDRTVFQR
jgi:uncharacterized HAD superfamily protein